MKNYLLTVVTLVTFTYHSEEDDNIGRDQTKKLFIGKMKLISV